MLMMLRNPAAMRTRGGLMMRGCCCANDVDCVNVNGTLECTNDPEVCYWATYDTDTNGNPNVICATGDGIAPPEAFNGCRFLARNCSSKSGMCLRAFVFLNVKPELEVNPTPIWSYPRELAEADHIFALGNRSWLAGQFGGSESSGESKYNEHSHGDIPYRNYKPYRFGTCVDLNPVIGETTDYDVTCFPNRKLATNPLYELAQVTYSRNELHDVVIFVEAFRWWNPIGPPNPITGRAPYEQGDVADLVWGAYAIFDN